MQQHTHISAPHAKSLIRQYARQWKRPYVECAHAAHDVGLLTAQGFVHRCGHTYYLSRPCTCVKGGIPELNCRACRGRGLA